jgi:integrase
MGSVTPYETASGRRYRVRYRKPDQSQTDKRGFKTKKDAELFLASVEVAKSRGEFVDSSAGRISIGELGAEWLLNLGHLKPSSARPLEIAWRLHVAPRWGRVRVADVSYSDVQSWIASQGGSPTTILRTYGVLASILDVAVRDRRISSNPARGINLPRRVGKERVYLTHARVNLLARSAGAFEPLVNFLAYTGLRWGEVVALQVRDVDLVRRRVFVRRNAVMVSGTIHVGTPKTHESRSVPYPEFLDFEMERLTKGKPDDGLVFGNGVGFLKPPDVRTGWWVRALKTSRLKDPQFPKTLTRHDLRHTAASLAISAGANVKAVQRMLGHASAAMTLDVYADLFDDDLDTVSRALNQARNSSVVGKMWANDHDGPPR